MQPISQLVTKNPQEWNPSSPYNPPTGLTMSSLPGVSDTGAQKQGAFPTTPSQDKANETKTKLTVNIKKNCTPFHWKHVLDGEIRGVNETKYVDIFTCSKMLIPVNIKLKHWILACIDFKQKWIAWFDSMSETHEEETRLLFTWLTREHSFNRTTKFDPGTNGPFILDRRPTPKSQRLRLRNI
jgi:hypothetical protein